MIDTYIRAVRLVVTQRDACEIDPHRPAAKRQVHMLINREQVQGIQALKHKPANASLARG